MARSHTFAGAGGLSIHPTEFFGTEPASVVIACSYDPLGLQGPLTVWLHSLTGQRCALRWVAYGMMIDALRDPKSAWCTNDAATSLNVLILRWHDLGVSCEADAAASCDPALLRFMIL